MTTVPNSAARKPGHEHGGFAMIPMWLVCHERVTPAALRVFAVLAGHVHEYGTWRLTHAEIQSDSGYERSTVIRALNLLRDLGVVDWETPDLRDPDQSLGCVYRIKIDRTGGNTPRTREDTPRVPSMKHPVFPERNTNIDSPETPHIQEGDSVAAPEQATLIDIETKRPKRRRSPEIPIPESWSPTAKHAASARDKGLDLKAEAERFRNHALAHDRRCVRWDAAFDNWLLKAVQFAPPKAAGDDDFDPVAEYERYANWRPGRWG